MYNKISIEIGKNYETEDGTFVHIWGTKKEKRRYLFLGYITNNKIYEEMCWSKTGKKIDNITKEIRKKDPLNIIREK